MKPFLLLLGLFLIPSLSAEHRALLAYAGPDRDKYLPALAAALSADPLDLEVVVSELDSGDVLKEARRFACDVLLTVTLVREQGRDLVTWSLRSPQEAEPRAGGTVSKAVADWSTAADLYWLFLVEPAQKVLAPGTPDWPQPAVSEKAVFAVAALPGTQIWGFPDGPHTVGEDGRYEGMVDLPLSLFLVGHLVDMKTKAIRVFVDRPGLTTTLEQTKEPRWALTASMANLTFPVIGGEWSAGNRLVVRGGIDQYLAGFLLKTGEGGSGSWPVQSIPLVSVYGGASWLWSWPDDQVGFYTAADLGLRVMFTDKSVAIDPVIPLTLLTAVGWEYKWQQGQAWYFELGPTFSLIPDPELYLSSLNREAKAGYFVLPYVPLAVELPFQSKVGYRWSF